MARVPKAAGGTSPARHHPSCNATFPSRTKNPNPFLKTATEVLRVRHTCGLSESVLDTAAGGSLSGVPASFFADPAAETHDGTESMMTKAISWPVDGRARRACMEVSSGKLKSR